MDNETTTGTRRTTNGSTLGRRLGAIAIASIMVLSVGLGIFMGFAQVHPANAETNTGHAAALSSALTHLPSAATKSTSYNWAGYAAEAKTAGTVYEVFAEWFIPTASCSQPSSYGASYSSQWVGIDGFANGNVSQTGSGEYCSGHGATPVYYLWYEFYPYSAEVVISTSVNAGDLVQAYVLYNPAACYAGICGVYTLEIYDSDAGINYATTGGGWVCNGGACEGGPAQSAECISEDPLPYVLTKTTSTTFYACAADINGAFKGLGSFSSTQATVYEITQLGPVSGLDAQTVSSMSSYYFGKSVFTVTWHRYR